MWIRAGLICGWWISAWMWLLFGGSSLGDGSRCTSSTVEIGMTQGTAGSVCWYARLGMGRQNAMECGSGLPSPVE